MNDLVFCAAPLTQHQHKDVQEKLDAIVRHLARQAAEHDHHQQEQQDTQRKDH